MVSHIQQPPINANVLFSTQYAPMGNLFLLSRVYYDVVSNLCVRPLPLIHPPSGNSWYCCWLYTESYLSNNNTKREWNVSHFRIIETSTMNFLNIKHTYCENGAEDKTSSAGEIN